MVSFNRSPYIFPYSHHDTWKPPSLAQHPCKSLVDALDKEQSDKATVWFERSSPFFRTLVRCRFWHHSGASKRLISTEIQSYNNKIWCQNLTSNQTITLVELNDPNFIQEATSKVKTEATTSSKAGNIMERLVEVVPCGKNAHSAHWFILKKIVMNELL